MSFGIPKVLLDLVPFRRLGVNISTEDRRVARDAVAVMLFLVLAKAIVALKEVAIAWRYGTSITVDAYIFIFNIINWPLMVWMSVVSAVLIPLVPRLRGYGDDSIALFRSELLAVGLLLGSGAVIIGWFLFPEFIRLPWLALSPAMLSEVDLLGREFMFLFLPGFLVGIFSSWMIVLRAHENTLFEAIPALAVCIVVLVLPKENGDSLVYGTLIGYFFHSLVLALRLATKDNLEPPRVPRELSPAWRLFFAGAGVMFVGQTLMGFSGLVDQFFAARTGAGSLAILGYANRLTGLFLALGATVITRSTFSEFSRIFVESGHLLLNMAYRWSVVFFLLGCLLVGCIWIISPWLVCAVFERGAFSAADTKAVTWMLQLSLFQIPFYFSGLIFVNVILVSRRFSWLLISGAVGLAIKFTGNVFLVPLIGMQAIPITTSVSYVGTFVLFVFLFSCNRRGDISLGA